MPEDKKENSSETELVKAVKEEYEKKFNEMKEQYDKEISDLKQNHTEQIKALISGREINLNDETKKLQEEKEESFEERLLKDTRKNFGIKEEK